jgi:hypothetical protein
MCGSSFGLCDSCARAARVASGPSAKNSCPPTRPSNVGNTRGLCRHGRSGGPVRPSGNGCRDSLMRRCGNQGRVCLIHAPLGLLCQCRVSPTAAYGRISLLHCGEPAADLWRRGRIGCLLFERSAGCFRLIDPHSHGGLSDTSEDSSVAQLRSDAQAERLSGGVEPRVGEVGKSAASGGIPILAETGIPMIEEVFAVKEE